MNRPLTIITNNATSISVLWLHSALWFWSISGSGVSVVLEYQWFWSISGSRVSSGAGVSSGSGITSLIM